MMKRLFLGLVILLGMGTAAPAQTIRNSNNSTLATISSSGEVRNSSGSLVGRVNSDGTVRNSNNSVIGYAKGVPMKYAALYFFFNLFKM